jgi:hypothetical protein
MVIYFFFLNRFLHLVLELNDFKTRRVQMFRKNLIDLTELQIKHTKVNLEFFYMTKKMFILGSNSNNQKCFTTIRNTRINNVNQILFLVFKKL